ncbi:MAG: PorT family protein [Fibrobacteria bacterium]|nr:PorT family protein [Fibrobacteria bacterium]
MKKYILLSLIVTWVSFTQAGGHLFLTGGVNLSTLGNKDADKTYLQYYPEPGFNAGLAYEWSFTKSFGLQAGLSYETRGEAGGQTLQEVKDSSWAVRYRYIQLPVLLVLSHKFGLNRVDFLVGPEIGRMLSDGVKEEFPVTGDTSNTGMSYTITNEEKNDLGITVGLGYWLDVSFGAVYIRPSYYYSLLNLNSAKNNHRNIRFQLGYGIGF